MKEQYWLMFLFLCYSASSQHIGPTCNISTHYYTIIDIKSSVAHNATLLNGTLASSLSECIELCCYADRCDLAVFMNNGTSNANRNCYLVQCGMYENCLLVGQSQFTTVSMSKGAELNALLPEITKPTASTSIPTTITEPTNGTTNPTAATNEPNASTTDVITTTSSEATEATVHTTEPNDVISNDKNDTIESTKSLLSQIITSMQYNNTVIVSRTTPAVIASTVTTSSAGSSTATTVVTTISPTAFDKKGDTTTVATPSGISGPEKEPNSSNRRFCGNADCSHSKIAGLVVAGLLVAFLLIIVLLVVVKKSWDRHRSKKYKRLDYLIDGMYS